MGGLKGRKKARGGSRARQAARGKKDEDEEDAETRNQQLDEWTAISAIFQEDCKLITESPFLEYSIAILPHSAVGDARDVETVSVDLVIRYVAGYPHRPPKVKVLSNKGLLQAEVAQLQDMLTAQAAAIAREGRVMVFNLAEAAQEFLSEHNTTDSSIWENLQGRMVHSSDVVVMKEEEDSVEEEQYEGCGWDDSVDAGLLSEWGGEGDSQWGGGVVGGIDWSLPFESAETSGQKWGKGKQTTNNVGLLSLHAASLKLKEENKGNEREHEHTKLGALKEEGRGKAMDGEAAAHEEGGKGKNSGQPVSREKCKGGLGGLKIGERDGRKVDQEVVDESRSASGESEGEDDIEEESEIGEGAETSGTTTSSVSELLLDVRESVYRMGQAMKSTLKDTLSTEESRSCSSDEEEQFDADETVQSPLGSEVITQSIQKDLLLAHLLRLVTSSRGPLPHSLPVLSSQLRDLGIMPQWTADLLSHKPQLVDKAFRRMFSRAARKATSKSEPTTRHLVKQFWTASPELQGEREGEGEGSSAASSRYLTDFEEVSLLGKGGFGHVVLCINKLDGRKYAVKKIRLKEKSPLLNSKILREVATLSRLQHNNVVRYYQAWFETGVGKFVGMLEAGSNDMGSASEWLPSGTASTTGSHVAAGDSTDSISGQATFLYIQMEYCPRTLRQVFDSYSGPVDKDVTWRIFRQIAEGLMHIHSQGIIHRDLTPNNIFFDARGDVKIGDFGLAKFTNLEATEKESNSSAAPGGGSLQGNLSTTGQVGTYFYTAPEIEQAWPHTDEKVDLYSLGVVLLELWHPFPTAMERAHVLGALKREGALPPAWARNHAQAAALVRWLAAPTAGDRPTAGEVLRSDLLPPRMEDEALDGVLRTLLSGEDSSVVHRVLGAVFDPDRLSAQLDRLEGARADHGHAAMNLVVPSDQVLKAVRSVFLRHGAVPTESRTIDFADEPSRSQWGGVKMADQWGYVLTMRHECRIPFARWVAASQITNMKRFEISRVYRRGVGRSVPREYHQGDFDIVGGSRPLADAEVIKVALEVLGECPPVEGVEVRLSHRDLLNGIWAWTGVARSDRPRVAQLLAVMSGAPPRAASRKAAWPVVRSQLLQGLRIAKPVVDRLQTVESRLSGDGDEALARLRGALPQSVLTSAALDELAALLGYLRIWGVEKRVSIDALMTPSEDFYCGIFFQVHARRAGQGFTTTVGGRGGPPSLLPPTCMAVGGRYDHLVRRFWSSAAVSAAPGIAGVSIGVEKLITACIGESKAEPPAEVLVCSRGGGGLLKERMEVVAELWAGGIKAEYVCAVSPSLTEQYEYANARGIKQLVIINEAALSATASVKIRRLDLKTEEEVARADLVKHFTDSAGASSNFRRRTLLARYGSSA